MNEDFYSIVNPYFKIFVPVVAPYIHQKDYLAIDLSVNNGKLNQLDLNNPVEIENYINDLLISKNKKIAYGGYLEKRLIYKRSNHFSASNDKEESRDIHLGIDLWCKQGTAVVCPFNGRIHSYKDNNNDGDYGPTIILSHEVNNYSWYTLYGHLSKESLKKINVGDEIKKGVPFAYLGNKKENGNYAPHLHFQIIKKIEGKKGDYPGVCSKKDKDFYVNNCPDPTLLLFP